jgi:hypothetical protein
MPVIPATQEVQTGGSFFRLVWVKRDTDSKIIKAKRNWRHDSSGTAPAETT